MGKGLEGLPCVLCGDPSTRKGEHVWPTWFIGEFHGEGPFETSKAGTHFTARDGSALQWPALPSVHVPMCERHNAVLNTTIEEPAKPIVRDILKAAVDSAWPVLSIAQVRTLALWLLKVGLLSAHPAAIHDIPQVDRDSSLPRLGPFLPEWIDWMANGTAPPAGFSVFLSRRGVLEDVELDRTRTSIALPRVIVDGKDLRLTSRSFGFRGLNVTIVWHPGWDIRNPQVEDGRAARLWPDPQPVDLATLPEVNPKEFQFVDAGIISVNLSQPQFDRIRRTPLSHESDLLQLMGDAIGNSSGTS